MTSRVSDAELAVLQVLWASGPQTARAITERIYPAGDEAAFASVHSFLLRLERKGYVARDRSAFAHLFSAKVSQSDLIGQELESLADRMSSGSLAPFLMHLVQNGKLSDAEVSDIKKLLDGYASKKRRSK